MLSAMPRISREEPEPKKKRPGWNPPSPNVDEAPEVVDESDTYPEIVPLPLPPKRREEQPPAYMGNWVIS